MPVVADPFFSFESLPFPIHRFTVDQYHRLGETGVLSPDDRVELLEGLIVKQMNQRPAHGFVVRQLNDWLQSRVPEGFLVQCQLPITLLNSEPEPDVAVVRGKHEDFRTRHPSGNDCRLIIEVADTSLVKDKAKAAIYASGKVEEYWIVNLTDETIIRMTKPTGSSYADTVEYGRTERLVFQTGGNDIVLSLDHFL